MAEFEVGMPERLLLNLMLPRALLMSQWMRF